MYNITDERLKELISLKIIGIEDMGITKLNRGIHPDEYRELEKMIDVVGNHEWKSFIDKLKSLGAMDLSKALIFLHKYGITESSNKDLIIQFPDGRGDVSVATLLERYYTEQISN